MIPRFLHAGRRPSLAGMLASLALCFAAPASAQDDVPATRDGPPIVAYLAPEWLNYPVFHLGQYMPTQHPVYDRPDGRRVGHLQFTGPEGPKLVRPGQPDVKLGVDIFIEDLQGLVTTQPLRPVGSQVWATFDVEDPAAKVTLFLWAPFKRPDVRRYLDLARTIRIPEVWCTKPGSCRSVSNGDRQMLEMAASKAQALFGTSDAFMMAPATDLYEIKGTVRRGGTLYYRVRWTLGAQTAAGDLPALWREGYVPAFDRKGRHMGVFTRFTC